jgi:ribosomal protein L40E
MEEHLKKRIMLGVIGGCLLLAGLISLMTRPRRMGIPAKFAKEFKWVKCRDPNCAEGYQITKKDYYVHIEKNTELWAMESPGLICKKCGEKSVYEAVKCEKCGSVFEVYSSVPRSFRDKCPKCGYSKIEKDREQARASTLRKKGARVSGSGKRK